MAINFNDNIRTSAPKPTDDRQYQRTNGLTPRPTVASVNAGIPVAQRYQGLTVFVQDGSSIKEYWYKDGITNSDLIEKTSSGGGGIVYVTKSQLNTLIDTKTLVPGTFYGITDYKFIEMVSGTTFLSTEAKKQLNNVYSNFSAGERDDGKYDLFDNKIVYYGVIDTTQPRTLSMYVDDGFGNYVNITITNNTANVTAQTQLGNQFFSSTPVTYNVSNGATTITIPALLFHFNLIANTLSSYGNADLTARVILVGEETIIFLAVAPNKIAQTGYSAFNGDIIEYTPDESVIQTIPIFGGSGQWSDPDYYDYGVSYNNNTVRFQIQISNTINAGDPYDFSFYGYSYSIYLNGVVGDGQVNFVLVSPGVYDVIVTDPTYISQIQQEYNDGYFDVSISLSQNIRNKGKILKRTNVTRNVSLPFDYRGKVVYGRNAIDNIGGEIFEFGCLGLSNTRTFTRPTIGNIVLTATGPFKREYAININNCENFKVFDTFVNSYIIAGGNSEIYQIDGCSMSVANTRILYCNSVIGDLTYNIGPGIIQQCVGTFNNNSLAPQSLIWKIRAISTFEACTIDGTVESFNILENVIFTRNRFQGRKIANIIAGGDFRDNIFIGYSERNTSTINIHTNNFLIFDANKFELTSMSNFTHNASTTFSLCRFNTFQGSGFMIGFTIGANTTLQANNFKFQEQISGITIGANSTYTDNNIEVSKMLGHNLGNTIFFSGNTIITGTFGLSLTNSFIMQAGSQMIGAYIQKTFVHDIVISAGVVLNRPKFDGSNGNMQSITISKNIFNNVMEITNTDPNVLQLFWRNGIVEVNRSTPITLQFPLGTGERIAIIKRTASNVIIGSSTSNVWVDGSATKTITKPFGSCEITRLTNNTLAFISDNTT